MSTLDQVEAFASGIIARDVPIVPDYASGPARAAAPSDHPRLWAYQHPSMAQVIAGEIGTQFERHVEGALIDARSIVFNPEASSSQRKLAARVLARWGM